MDISPQITLLQGRIAEPTDGSTGRWTSTQLVAELISARRILAEETRCFPTRSTQTVSATTSGSACYISVPNDLIGYYQLEYDGRPLRVVQSINWADVIGQDDTIQGDPAVSTYFGRQFQLFPCPQQSGKTLLYRGWAYPDDIVVGGSDTQFTDKAADTAIWVAAAALKANDERSADYPSKMAAQGITALKKQYMAKGPRFVQTGDLYIPLLGALL